MKKGMLEEAMNNIPEEFKLEALETHNHGAQITSINRKSNIRKALVVAIAASFILALGITAGATGLFGMVVRNPEPNETIEMDIGDHNNPLIIDTLSKIVKIEGPDECDKVEFKANYLPKNYTSKGGEFGNPKSWNDFLQVETPGGAINIYLFYSAQLGKDGCLFLADIEYSENRYQKGEYEVVELSGSIENLYSEELHTENYVVMYHPDGYVLVISGFNDIKVLEKVADGIEVRKAGGTVRYNPDGDHKFMLFSGVG